MARKPWQIQNGGSIDAKPRLAETGSDFIRKHGSMMPAEVTQGFGGLAQHYELQQPGATQHERLQLKAQMEQRQAGGFRRGGSGMTMAEGVAQMRESAPPTGPARAPKPAGGYVAGQTAPGLGKSIWRYNENTGMGDMIQNEAGEPLAKDDELDAQIAKARALENPGQVQKPLADAPPIDVTSMDRPLEGRDLSRPIPMPERNGRPAPMPVITDGEPGFSSGGSTEAPLQKIGQIMNGVQQPGEKFLQPPPGPGERRAVDQVAAPRQGGFYLQKGEDNPDFNNRQLRKLRRTPEGNLLVQDMENRSEAARHSQANEVEKFNVGEENKLGRQVQGQGALGRRQDQGFKNQQQLAKEAEDRQIREEGRKAIADKKEKEDAAAVKTATEREGQTGRISALETTGVLPKQMADYFRSAPPELVKGFVDVWEKAHKEKQEAEKNKPRIETVGGRDYKLGEGTDVTPKNEKTYKAAKDTYFDLMKLKMQLAKDGDEDAIKDIEPDLIAARDAYRGFGKSPDTASAPGGGTVSSQASERDDLARTAEALKKEAPPVAAGRRMGPAGF